VTWAIILIGSKTKFINSYTWIRWKGWRLTKILALNCTDYRRHTMVLFGNAVASDQRKSRASRIIKASSKHSGKQLLLQQILAYEDWSFKYKGPHWTHGVALSMDTNGVVYLYDSGRARRFIATPLEMTKSIVCIEQVFEFGLIPSPLL
jgi:hypothetical protein